LEVFEGNAQTLRIITRLEKKLDDPERQLDLNGNPRWFDDGGDCSFGLNLCSRTIASVIKYDKLLPPGDSQKGYYHSEISVVEEVRKRVGPEAKEGCFKTVECQIMDIADDIAYSTYDLEDAFKAGLVDPLDILYPERSILQAVAIRAQKGLGRAEFSSDDAEEALHRCLSRFKMIAGISKGTHTLGKALALAKTYARDGFFRNTLTSGLVNRFVSGISLKFKAERPSLSTVTIDHRIAEEIEALKHFVFVSMIESSRLKIVSRRSEFIVDAIMEALMSPGGFELLPPDFEAMYKQAALLPLSADDSSPGRHCMRVLCDFVAGMTDRFAVEFFCRLRSETYQTIFRDI
jgi:dGTPase